MVQYLQRAFQVGERRACSALPIHRSSYRYKSIAEPYAALRMRLRDLAATRVGWGYRRLTIALQREGWQVGKKLVYRLYLEENLLLRRKRPRRRLRSTGRQTPSPPLSLNERWSMDFMSDSLGNGRRFRVLTIVDDYSRESVCIRTGFRITGAQVATVLQGLARKRGLPKILKVDNGPEFTSVSLDQWAYWNKVQLNFSRPGTPTDNAVIESFNARVRQECLNAHWFENLDAAQAAINTWRQTYNNEHPHSSLGDIPPKEFARNHQKATSK